jgi:protein TonB
MEIELSVGQFFIAILLMVVALVAIIYGLRYLIQRRSKANLKEEYGTDLKARNKYPDVNAFKYSGTMLGIGVATSIAFVLFSVNLTEYEKEIIVPDYEFDVEEEIEVEPPRTKEPPPPPPPPPPPEIEEVVDEEVEEDPFEDQTIEEDTYMDDEVPEQVEEAPPPPPPPPEPEVEEIFKVVEQMPRFPGCEDLGSEEEKKQCAQKKLLEYIYANIKYPPIARENGVEGMVVVKFVVDKDGSISDPQVVRDIGAGCGDEALRVVKSMNKENIKWIPGKQRGRPVRVQFNLPVKFQLQ